MRLVVTDDRRLPPFQAGQCVNLFTNIQGVATARPYAISPSPAERDLYDLTVKRAKGGFVSHYRLDEVIVGQDFQTSGPMGTVHYNPLFHGDELAGGSRIAPAMSMIRHVLGATRALNGGIIAQARRGPGIKNVLYLRADAV